MFGCCVFLFAESGNHKLTDSSTTTYTPQHHPFILAQVIWTSSSSDSKTVLLWLLDYGMKTSVIKKMKRTMCRGKGMSLWKFCLGAWAHQNSCFYHPKFYLWLPHSKFPLKSSFSGISSIEVLFYATVYYFTNLYLGKQNKTKLSESILCFINHNDKYFNNTISREVEPHKSTSEINN